MNNLDIFVTLVFVGAITFSGAVIWTIYNLRDSSLHKKNHKIKKA